VRSAHVPEQISHHVSGGTHVTIGGPQLAALNELITAAGELAVAQVHSHPYDAYHSEADDQMAPVTVLGALSIVVPRFGRHGLRGPGVIVHRLERSGWMELEAEEAARVLHLHPATR
jgi:hypothetical protein